MNRRLTIRGRLLALIGLLLLLVLGTFGTLAWHRESQARLAATDRELDERLNMLITSLRPAEGQRLQDVNVPRFSPRARELFANEGGEPYRYRVWLGDGKLQARSEDAEAIAKPEGSTDSRFHQTRGSRREVVFFTQTGRCLLVARDISRDKSAMASDALSLAAIGAVILLIGLGLAWWIAGQITRPLREVGAVARQIAGGDLSRRIEPTGGEDELTDVIKTLNETFARLDESFSRQKRFTADASHELRTPVSLILAHAQGALLREQTPEDYREALNDCAEAAKRMRQLIESLLELSRFDAGSPDLRLSDCDLADIAQSCANELSPLTDAKGIKVVLELRPAPCKADASRIAQVVTNLMANAIRFTPAGGNITLNTCPGEHSSFTIRDTGPGIPADQAGRLFERFHRSDASRTRDTGGTGLGLSICKAIIDAHGGEIRHEAGQLKGCVFTFQLPR